MENKSSTPESYTISGFGGKYNEKLPDNLTPFSLTGTYIINKEITAKAKQYMNEVATLETTKPQVITIGTRTYKFLPGTYYINKTLDDKYTLINDSKNPLKNLIKPVSMGGRRKRQTKGRKAKKHSRRRRSIRA